MISKERFAAIVLAVAMSFTLMACAGIDIGKTFGDDKDVSESSKSNPNAEIREQIFGDWESPNKTYTFSASYSQDHRFVQTFSANGEVVESVYIRK